MSSRKRLEWKATHAAVRHLPAPGGEVVDDDDVVVLCQCLCKVRADEAGAAGDDVAHEESMLMPWFSSFLTVLLKEQSGMIGVPGTHLGNEPYIVQ